VKAQRKRLNLPGSVGLYGDKISSILNSTLKLDVVGGGGSSSRGAQMRRCRGGGGAGCRRRQGVSSWRPARHEKDLDAGGGKDNSSRRMLEEVEAIRRARMRRS
jgi:hypothetical protein